MSDAMERCISCGIVPVVVIRDAADAADCARALLAGGVDVMEITMRTSAAVEAVKNITKEVPEMLVGAGTVLNLAQCKEIVQAGAKFIVSPGYDEETVSYCLANNIPVLPGCVTPTEIMRAMAKGLHIVKFFPADVYGGLKAMKALSAPYTELRFIPTGGANMSNLAEYIASPFVAAVGGSFLCTADDIAAHEFDKITSLAKEAREIISASSTRR